MYVCICVHAFTPHSSCISTQLHDHTQMLDQTGGRSFVHTHTTRYPLTCFTPSLGPIVSWQTTQVIKNQRCTEQLWQKNPYDRKEAETRCDSDPKCIGLMWLNNAGARRTKKNHFLQYGPDGRAATSGWYQGCGGSLAGDTNNDWDTIERPDKSMHACMYVCIHLFYLSQFFDNLKALLKISQACSHIHLHSPVRIGFRRQGFRLPCWICTGHQGRLRGRSTCSRGCGGRERQEYWMVGRKLGARPCWLLYQHRCAETWICRRLAPALERRQ